MEAFDKDLPRIRQTLFHIDKNRKYQFDVNQTITIRSLKKMIMKASNVAKSGLKLFHKGIEYTKNDDDSIGALFPDLQLIEFRVDLVYNSDEEKESSTYTKLKFGKHCSKHPFKYPYLYCYDCELSICRLCLAGDHERHRFIEKYDYLQSSRNLVENIFHDLNDDQCNGLDSNLAKVRSNSEHGQNLKNDQSIGSDNNLPKVRGNPAHGQLVNNENFNNELIELENTIRLKNFGELHKLLDEIQTNQLDLLNSYKDLNKTSGENMKYNVKILKKYCAEGLDKLKDEITIEDLIYDEEVFLTFHSKFNKIKSEKTKIINATRNYDDFRNLKNELIILFEKEYNEILNFLTALLSSDIHPKMKSKFSEKAVVVPINRDSINDILLSDVKTGKKKRLQETPTNSKIQRVGDAEGVQPFNLQKEFNKNYQLSNNKDEIELSRTKHMRNENIDNNISNIGRESKTENESKNSLNDQNINNILSDKTNICNLNFNHDQISKDINNRNVFIRDNNLSEDVNMTSESNNLDSNILNSVTLKNTENLNNRIFQVNSEGILLTRCVPDTKQVMIYKNSSDTITRQNVVFNSMLNIDHFLPRCSSVNVKGLLYISGGLYQNVPSNIFLRYNPLSNELTRLKDLPEPRHSHSMIFYDKFIYIVGGNSEKCERYSIDGDDKFLKLTDLLTKNNPFPALFVFQNFLYSFSTVIQRLNLNNQKEKWRIVGIKNLSENLKLNVIGCGILKSGPDEILLLGGQSSQSNSCYKYNFREFTLQKIDLKLKEGINFQESDLVDLGNNSFGQFEMDNQEFCKIEFS